MTLVITIPAENPSLLTEQQLRIAAGLSADDDSRDDDLEALGLRISAEIAHACNIAVGSGGQATLRQETLTETLRRHGEAGPLVLARRHNIVVTSVALADGSAIASTDYDVDPESGLIRREWNHWGRERYTIVYRAGFDEVPADLAGIAIDLARIRLAEQGRDPTIRTSDVTIPGVEEVSQQFWVGAIPSVGQDASLPGDLLARLKRYMNVRVG